MPLIGFRLNHLLQMELAKMNCVLILRLWRGFEILVWFIFRSVAICFECLPDDCPPACRLPLLCVCLLPSCFDLETFYLFSFLKTYEFTDPISHTKTKKKINKNHLKPNFFTQQQQQQNLYWHENTCNLNQAFKACRGQTAQKKLMEN